MRIHALLAFGLLLTAGPPDRLSAQARDSARTTKASPKRTKPVDALFQSLFIPGWGQASTGRYTAGAMFAVWEGVTIMMTARAVQEKHYMEETGSDNVASKGQQVQDWVVLLVFNHLFSAAEAYVAAHLQDFPGELKVRAGPGGAGFRVTLPVP
jgi:hypothetical protein